MISQGLFREDLFFRINVFPLSCPSLAERLEDIPVIVHNFIAINSAKGGKEISGLTPEAMVGLLTYSWPGNVRELRNAIEYASVLCPGGWIGEEHLPPKITMNRNIPSSNTRSSTVSWQEEREKLIHTLRRFRGNQSETARALGVSRVTIWKRIKKYDIDLAADIGRMAGE
jgi:DNA-binding NtrC family response regulator